MKIKLTSVMVDDQAKALKFYTEVLGFTKKTDLPVDGELRWITVVSPEGPDDIELALEPNDFPPAKTFQRELLEAGIPATAFFVDDVEREYERLSRLGVAFTKKPTRTGVIVEALFADTCGNLILLLQG